MGRNPREGSLCRLRDACATITQVLRQLDGLVQTAQTLDAEKKIGDHDLCELSEFLETTSSSLQEWIPRFTNAPGVCPDKPETENEVLQPSLQEHKQLSKEATRISEGNSILAVQSNVLKERLGAVDAMSDEKGHILSDSPLLPWLDKVQFFILTPMAKPGKDSWPFPINRRAEKAQDTLRTSAERGLMYSLSGIAPVDLSPSLDACAETMCKPAILPSMLAFDTHMGENEIKQEALEVPANASSTPSCVVQHCIVECADNIDVTTPSQLVRQRTAECSECRESVDIASPSCFQSLVKRYSHYFETNENFSDSSVSPPVTPGVDHNQDGQEGMEITEFFTAFSPPKSLAPYLSRSGLSPSSVDDSPQSKTDASGQRPNTPIPFQSLMKRYSQCLHIEQENPELSDFSSTLTPMLAGSPPKTCALMRPNWKDSSKRSSRKPILYFRSPFRTPVVNLSTALDHSFYEDMELTSLKKPLQSSLPAEFERTPSSDMQFATLKKALNTIKRTPFVDLQLSTAQKPGAQFAGEQTLKRELWCRMEAEFASMAHVCKSLFNDAQMGGAVKTRVVKAGVENRRQSCESKLGPRLC